MEARQIKARCLFYHFATIVGRQQNYLTSVEAASHASIVEVRCVKNLEFTRAPVHGAHFVDGVVGRIDKQKDFQIKCFVADDESGLPFVHLADDYHVVVSATRLGKREVVADIGEEKEEGVRA